MLAFCVVLSGKQHSQLRRTVHAFAVFLCFVFDPVYFPCFKIDFDVPIIAMTYGISVHPYKQFALFDISFVNCIRFQETIVVEIVT